MASLSVQISNLRVVSAGSLPEFVGNIFVVLKDVCVHLGNLLKEISE